MVTTKREARKWCQITRVPLDKTHLKKPNRETEKINNESTSHYLEGLTCDQSTDYCLWHTTRKTKILLIHIPHFEQQIMSGWVANYLENVYSEDVEVLDSESLLHNSLEGQKTELATTKEVLKRSVQTLIKLKLLYIISSQERFLKNCHKKD